MIQTSVRKRLGSDADERVMGDFLQKLFSAFPSLTGTPSFLQELPSRSQFHRVGIPARPTVYVLLRVVVGIECSHSPIGCL